MLKTLSLLFLWIGAVKNHKFALYLFGSSELLVTLKQCTECYSFVTLVLSIVNCITCLTFHKKRDLKRDYLLQFKGIFFI